MAHVILVDTNVWIALTLHRHQFHRIVTDWSEQLPRQSTLLFCRATQQSFLRLLTTEHIMARYTHPAMTNHKAWQIMEAYLANPHIKFVDEPANLAAQWKNLVVRQTASPKLWMDAYLAAFAIAGNHEFVTTDSAFAQFPKLTATILTKL